MRNYQIDYLIVEQMNNSEFERIVKNKPLLGIRVLLAETDSTMPRTVLQNDLESMGSKVVRKRPISLTAPDNPKYPHGSIVYAMTNKFNAVVLHVTNENELNFAKDLISQSVPLVILMRANLFRDVEVKERVVNQSIMELANTHVAVMEKNPIFDLSNVHLFSIQVSHALLRVIND